MTILVMAAILFAGLFGYALLPVSALPNIDFPTIVVNASLPGADADTMASAVATPLENQFSLIPGLDTMSSQSGQGSTQITLQFRLDRNIDAAAQDVQSAISASSHALPSNIPSPPTMRKVNPAEISVLLLSATSPTMPLSVLDGYMETIVIRRLSTIDGVANVDIFGEQRPAVRIQVDPTALATRGIGIDQVATAIRNANVNEATGQLNGPTRSAVIHTTGQLTNAAAYLPQIIAYQNGAPVRLGDVATVIDGVENPRLSASYNGTPSITLGVNRQPGANTLAVVNAVKAALPGVRSELPPSVTLQIREDRSISISDSVADVQITLLLAAALVVGVIFLFLRTVSATFIPSIALPITIVGTFAGMAACGFSLDNLSLLALTLCVGFVVDDAIIMLENIMRHVEAGETPYQAALTGSREIGFTILSMTVSLAAVFIPVLFMGGIVGRLLNEFAVTIVIAIVVSGIVSVTLTPMLCSRLIKPASEHGSSRQKAFYRLSEGAFTRLQAGYAQSLAWSLRHRGIILGIFAASLVATAFLFEIMPEDFLPSEDAGVIQGFTEGANGISYDEMKQHQDQIADIIRHDPYVEGTTSSVGAGGVRGGNNAGTVRLTLKPRSERPSIDNVIAELREKVQKVPGINVYLQNRPIITIGGLVSKAQYQYTLQDADLPTLYASALKLEGALSKTPGFLDVTSDFDNTTPAVNVAVNRDRAGALGISVQKIEDALGAAFGGQQVSTIYTATDQYKVILELLPQYQQDAQSLSTLYLMNDSGTLVPLDTVTDIGRGSQPLSINHFGQLPAVTLSFSLPQGMALSDAVTRLNAVEAQINMSASVQTSFQGTAKAFQQSMQGMGYLLLGAILVVYLVLGILYESFIHPLTILSGLPAAAVGALITLWAFHMPLNLYAFVGIIMLVGIVKKNAIMMIDFALVREREHGLDADTAIAEAAVIRFRPIMMTTMAALMGTLPIAIGFGTGGEGRQPLGLAVVGGLILSQALTLYITPVIYGSLDRAGDWLSRARGKRVPASAE